MDAVKEKWNPERSARQNLASMGLAANPNEAVGGGRVGARADAAHEVAKAAAVAAEVDANELFEIPESDDLRSVDANSRRRKQPMMEKDVKVSCAYSGSTTHSHHSHCSHHSHHPPTTITTTTTLMKYIEKLVGKHGEDYTTMARDIKLNVRQLTAKNLEKMAARWKLL